MFRFHCYKSDMKLGIKLYSYDFGESGVNSLFQWYKISCNCAIHGIYSLQSFEWQKFKNEKQDFRFQKEKENNSLFNNFEYVI